MAFTTLLRNPRIVRMVAVRAISFVAFEAVVVATTLELFRSGAPPFHVSLVLLASAVPCIAASPLIGYLVDSRSTGALVTLSAGGAVVAAPSLGLAAGDHLAVYVALVGVLAVLHAGISASTQCRLPDLVGTRQLTAVMGLSQTVTTLGGVLAPVAAGLLFAAGQFAAVTMVVALLYLIALALGLTIGTADRQLGASPVATGRREALTAGMAHILHDPVSWRLLVVLGALATFIGATNVVEVFLLRGELEASAREFGVIVALWAVGIVAGARVAERAKTDTQILRFALLSSMVAAAVSIGLGVAPHLLLAAVLLLVGGTANGILSVTASSAVIGRAPKSVRGRAAMTLSALANSAMLASFVTGGLMAAVLSPRELYVTAGAASLSVTLALGIGPLLTTHRRGRRGGLTGDTTRRDPSTTAGPEVLVAPSFDATHPISASSQDHARD